MDDIISIVKKELEDILFRHLNSVDSHIKFTMEAPGNDGSISFLDTKCPPNLDLPHIPVYTKPIHTACYINWKSNHPILAKRTSINVLIHRTIYVYSTHEILAKELNCPHCVLKNNQSNWKETNNSHHKSMYWPRCQDECLHLHSLCSWPQWV